MQHITQHPTVGTIRYEESFWTGKRQISINDTPLVKTGKKEYIYTTGNPDAPKKTVTVTGSFLFGAKMLLNGECIALTPPAKWYDIVCSLFIVFFVLTWGNSPWLCSIFPIVGGAIGGAVSGMMCVLSLTLMRSARLIRQKLLYWLILLIATVLICFLLATLMLSF